MLQMLVDELVMDVNMQGFCLMSGFGGVLGPLPSNRTPVKWGLSTSPRARHWFARPKMGCLVMRVPLRLRFQPTGFC